MSRHEPEDDILRVSTEEYEMLLAELDAPPKVIPGLRKLMQEHGPFTSDEADAKLLRKHSE